MREPAVIVVRALGSLKLTLPLMVGLVVAVLGSYRFGLASIWWTVVPLLGLAVNLAAALLGNPRFRRQSGLLVFHIALLLLLLMAAYGQLTSLTGRVEIAGGQVFSPDLLRVESRGPWHDLAGLQSVRFTQGALAVDYAPQLVRGRTRSEVLQDGTGASLVVGDNVPLTQGGYRFYTTPNKGFAAYLAIRDIRSGAVELGTVHFPSYPLHDWDQQLRWTTPGGEELLASLELAVQPDFLQDWTLNDSLLGGATLTISRQSGERHTLTPGGSVQFGGQAISLQALRSWVGYEVFFNPVLSLLLATALVAVGGLAWHFWTKLGSKSLSKTPTQVKHRSDRWVHT